MLGHEDKPLPFRCGLCDFSCKRKENLKSHVVRVHEKSKGTSSAKRRHESTASGRNKVSEADSGASGGGGSGGGAEVDKSHIVGHVNKDGSIEPVSGAAAAASASGTTTATTGSMQEEETEVEIEVDISGLNYLDKAVLVDEEEEA